MLFYINTISSINQRFVELSSQHVFTEDKTLDNVKVVLECNDTKTPYAPMQKFIVLFDDNTRQDYYIVSDSVELYSNTPLRYKHSLTLTQNTRALSKRILRNTVFTQPANTNKRLYYSISNYKDANGDYNSYPASGTTHDSWQEPLILGTKEKIRRAYLVIKGTGVGMAYNPNTPSLINYTNTSQFTYDSTKFVITYTDKNGTVTTTPFYLSNNVQCNERIYETSYIDPSKPSINLTNVLKAMATNGGNIKIELGSPTYVFADHTKGTYQSKDVIVENIQLELFVETYIYTAYDVLDIVIKQLKQKHSIKQNDDIFTLPASGDLYDLLKTTIAPNFAFTQSTVFDAIAEVFNLFDATLTLDENNVLGIEYLNEANKQMIADNQFVGINQAQAETNYNNSLISFYQDARVEENYPSEKGYAGVRFAELGIPSNSSSMEIGLPHKIDYINRIKTIDKKFTIANFHETGNPAAFTNTPLEVDITYFCVENSVYYNLPTTGDFPYLTNPITYLTSANTISYNRGASAIQIGKTYNDYLGFNYYAITVVRACGLYRYWGFSANSVIANAYVTFDEGLNNVDFPALRFNVDYLTSVDGITKVHSLDNKYDGEEIINQVNGAVDLTKLGLNMLGLSLKLGQPIMAMTHQISDWNNRIQKGQLYFKDNEYWVANICTYTNLGNGYYLGNIEFSKNFNALSQRITLNKEKRFTNISANLVCKSEEIVTNFIYLSSVAFTQASENIALYPLSVISNSLLATFGKDISNLITSATIKDNSNNEVIIPLHKYCAGDTINFEIAYLDPINAGNKTSQRTFNGVTAYYTSPTIYTDSNGFLDITNIHYGNIITQDVGFGNYPSIALDNTYIYINNYEFYKKPNEIFAFNYQVAFLPLAGRMHTDFIGQEFMKNNSLLFMRQDEGNRVFYFSYKINGFKYSILDTKAEYDEKIKITNVTFETTASYQRLNFSFEHSMASNSALAWAITDSDDNIYFASNEPIENTTDTIYLYFIPKRNRI